jgi:hypothetical protein
MAYILLPTLLFNKTVEVNMETKRNMNKHWLRPVAYLASIGLLIEIIIWGLYHYEGGPSWFAVLPLSIYIVPFALCLLIAWRKPFIGGLVLVGIAVILIIYSLALGLYPTSQSVLTVLWSRFSVTLPIIIPQLITGVLFLLIKEEVKR